MKMWTVSTLRYIGKHLSGLFVNNLNRCDKRSVGSFRRSFYDNTKKIVWYGVASGVSAAAVYFLVSKNDFLLPNILFPVIKTAEKLTPKQSARQTMNFIVDVVDNVSPCVVFIETTGTQQTMYGYGVVQSHGSGFVVRSDGLILTNAHVVQGARKVRIKLQNEKIYDGIIVALDRTSDLALVKINASDLPVLKLAKSAEAKAGEIVIALGSPLALSNSVTFGIISNSQRKLTDRASFAYIQTDAAITTGNSGGPLVNLDGEAVGINCMTVANAPGISFAIPSDYAKKFIDSRNVPEKSGLDAVKSRSKPKYMGITMLALDKEVLNEIKFRSFDFPNVDHGILVHTVTIGSPAHKCGIEPGDVIVAVDGKDVHTIEEIMDYLGSFQKRKFESQHNKRVNEIKIVDKKSGNNKDDTSIKQPILKWTLAVLTVGAMLFSSPYFENILRNQFEKPD